MVRLEQDCRVAPDGSLDDGAAGVRLHEAGHIVDVSVDRKQLLPAVAAGVA